MHLRYATRTLTRTPGFTAVAVLTLALGIGATTAMIAVVNSVLFRPLPYQDPDRLYVGLTDVSRPGNAAGTMLGSPVNARHFSEWRAQCRACDEVAMVGGAGYTATGGEAAAERIPGFDVSYNFFRTLGLHPRLGRDFAPGDEGPAGSRVVLLTDELWRARFGADPSVVGRSIQLDGESNTIVGVMPPGLTLPRGTQWGPFFGQPSAPLLFRPFAVDIPRLRTFGQFNYYTVVRLKPGETTAHAAAEMTAAIAPFSRESGVDMSAVLVPMDARITGGIERRLWMLVAAVVAVLALVSLNIGGLMLARGIGKARETSIRMALGASRSNVLATVAAEVLVLTSAGGALGVLVSMAALRAFVAAGPVDLPRIDEVHADWRILAFAVAATALSSALAALAPAWRVLRHDPSATIGSSTRSNTDSKGRVRALDAIMTAEVALSTTVLVLGSLLILSFIHVLNSDRNFETRRVVTDTLPLSSRRYATLSVRVAFVRDALAAFARLPGVSTVGEVSQLPLAGETWTDGLVDADQPHDNSQVTAPIVNRRFVSPGYLAAMGIPLLAGRDISDADGDQPVALLSERAARLLWHGENAVGRRILGSSTQATVARPVTVVIGIVADVRSAGLEQDPAPIVYEPYWRVGPSRPSFVFRTDRDAGSLATDLRDAVASIDRDVPVAPPKTMDAIVSDSASVRRFQTELVGAFAFGALAIAAIGLFGLVSFSVARRKRELGLRLALGATPRRILLLVLGQGLRPVAIGASAGMLVSFEIADLLRDQLYRVSANDPVAFAAVGGTLLLVALAACWIPARRATRVDPMIPLRAE